MESQAPKAYETVALYVTDKSEAPVSGKSFYIILEVEKNRVTLWHPFSMTKFGMAMHEFLLAQVQNDWNPAPEKLADLIETKLSQNKKWGRETPSFVKLLAKHYRSLG